MRQSQILVAGERLVVINFTFKNTKYVVVWTQPVGYVFVAPIMDCVD